MVLSSKIPLLFEKCLQRCKVLQTQANRKMKKYSDAEENDLKDENEKKEVMNASTENNQSDEMIDTNSANLDDKPKDNWINTQTQ